MEYENEDILEFQKAVEALAKPNTDDDPKPQSDLKKSNNKKTLPFSL